MQQLVLCTLFEPNDLLYLDILNLLLLFHQYPAYVLLWYLGYLTIDPNRIYVTLSALCCGYVFAEKVEFAIKQLILLDRENLLGEEFALRVEEQGVDGGVPMNLIDPFLKAKMVVRVLLTLDEE